MRDNPSTPNPSKCEECGHSNTLEGRIVHGPLCAIGAGEMAAREAFGDFGKRLTPISETPAYDREAIIEECARICDERQDEGHDDGIGPSVCAIRIRALKNAAPQVSSLKAPSTAVSVAPAVAAPNGSDKSSPTARNYCEACGHTESHDPNCPRPRPSLQDWIDELDQGGDHLLQSHQAEKLVDLLKSLSTSATPAYVEFYEASEAFRLLPWFKDGRNDAEREAAAERLERAHEAVAATRPDSRGVPK